MKRIAFLSLVLALFAYGGLKDVNENDVTASTPFGDVDGETGTVGDLLSLGISSNDVSGIIGAAIDKGTIATPTDIANATKELNEQVGRDRAQSIAEATNGLASHQSLAGYATTNALAAALASAVPGDYANVSNRAVNSVQEGSFPLAGIDINTNGIVTIGNVSLKAEAGRNGVAVGGNANAADDAVVVGTDAEAKEAGVAVGIYTSAAESSVAIGCEAWANNKYSTAIGPYANASLDYMMALSYMPEQLYFGAWHDYNQDVTYSGKSLQSFLDERVAVSGNNVKSMALSPAGVLTSVTTTTVTNSITNAVVTVATNRIEFATTDALAAAVADAGKVKSVNGEVGDVEVTAAGIGAASEADVNSVWGYMKGEVVRLGTNTAVSADSGYVVTGVVIGAGAWLHNQGTAIGEGAQAAYQGTAIGEGAQAAYQGTAIGWGAQAKYLGTAIGWGAHMNASEIEVYDASGERAYDLVGLSCRPNGLFFNSKSDRGAYSLQSLLDKRAPRYKFAPLSTNLVVASDGALYSLAASTSGFDVVLPDVKDYAQDFVIRVYCADEAGTQIGGISNLTRNVDFPSGDLYEAGSLKGTNYVTFTQTGVDTWCIGHFAATKEEE